VNQSTLADPDNVRTWANAASAYAVYGNVYQVFAVADGEQQYPDPACPALEDDGTTLTATGDCTASDGAAWVGSAVVVRSADGDRALTLDGFGTTDGTRQGEAHLRVVSETSTDFELSLSHLGGGSMSFVYAGRVDGGYGTRTVWNGSGTVTRDGPGTPTGTVDVTTTDEVIDGEVCSGPASGNTTIHNDADESAIVTYDGAIDCDGEEAASYSVDGVPKGKLTGIICSMSRRPDAGGGGTAWLGVGFALLLAGSRRRRAW
jgi:hypothetical protein